MTSIEPWAFESSSIETVVIPNTVTSIGEGAFSSCSSLTSITIPESVVSIGRSAFDGCSALTEITIPIGVTSIEGHTFYNCTNLASIALSANTTKIGYSAFNNCSSLTSITLPDSLLSIEFSAFYNCNNLKNITLPNGLISIGSSAFYNCKSLTNITLPDNITNLESKVFYECSNLANITLPTHLQKIGSYAFYYCAKLSKVVIPESVTSIGSYAFSKCYNLSSIELSEGISSIGAEAFRSCKMSSITLPDSIGSIDNNAFMSCSYLVEIIIPTCNSYAYQWAKSYGYDNKMNVLTHQDVQVLIEGVEPTCQANGLTEYIICGTCEEVISPQTEIPRLPHTPVIDSGIPATDTDAGLTEGSHCAVCGEIIVSQQIIPPLWDFEISDSTVSLLKYNGSESNLTVPTMINGKTVTEIGENAFAISNCPRRVFIPRTVTLISDTAFAKNTIVYCYRYSEADFWADDVGYSKVYVDNTASGDFYIIQVPAGFRLECGNSQQLDTIVWPITGAEQLIWSSTTPDSVTVENGVVTALKPGSATVTLQVGGVMASVDVVAYAFPSDFSISETDLYVISGEPTSLEIAYIVPEGAEIEIAWSTSNSRVVDVDQSGTITPKRIGSATIYATSQNGIVRECTVTVCYPVTEISLNNSVQTIYIGDNYTLIANVSDGVNTYQNKLVAFNSSNEEIAVVNDSGTITGVHYGIATITAEASSGVSASIEVTVKCPNHIIILEPAVAPTCTETGLTEGSYCAFCGEVFVSQEVLPALGHDYHIVEEIPAHSGIDGQLILECSNCNDRQKETLQSTTSSNPMVGTWRPHHIYSLLTLDEVPRSQWGRMADTVFIYYANGTFEFWAFDEKDQQLKHGSSTWHYSDGEVIWDVSGNAKMFSDDGYYSVPTANHLICLSPGGENLTGYSQYLGNWKSNYIYRERTDRRLSCKYWPAFTGLNINIANDHSLTVNGNEGHWNMIGNTFIVDGEPGWLFTNSYGQMMIDLDNGDYLYLNKQDQEIYHIKSLLIPQSIKAIDNEAFYGIAAEEVIIPNGCTSIGEKAFSQCTKLGAVIIPNSVTSIMDDAFEGSNVTICTAENSYAWQWALDHNTDVIKLE